MANTIVNQTVGAPIGTGTVPLTSSVSDVGLCVLEQAKTITKNTTGTVTFDTIVYLPPNSKIIDFLIDLTTAWDSATSSGLTGGSASTGTQYFSSFDLKGSTGRTRPTFTAAQLTAMSNISTSTGLYLSVAQVGATTAGSVTVTVVYAQTASAGTQ